MKKILLIGCLLMIGKWGIAQKELTLEDAISRAQSESVEVKQAQARLEAQRWNYKSFQAGLLPQLSVEGIIPAYNKTYNPITQPDGSLLYQSIEQNNLNLQLNLEQQIGFTGGSVFVGSQLSRFDDLQRDTRQYNTQPFYIGYSQPLMKYNALKWSKQIEPLKLQEAEKAYNEQMESVAYQTVQLYFNALKAQWQANIAANNLQDNQKILEITKEKKSLGRASENDLLQVELNVLNAEQQVTSADLTYDKAMRALMNYLNIETEKEVELVLSKELLLTSVNSQTALEKAQTNRQDLVAFQRNMLEAESKVAKAKGENRFQADLSVAVGFSNQAQVLSDAYQEPIQSQQVSFTFRMPLLDWGRGKAAVGSAQMEREVTSQMIKQSQMDFTREIQDAVQTLSTVVMQAQNSEAADRIAQKKYDISLKRFQLGDISIRELVWSAEEKDSAKNRYIASLEAYWLSYYQLRMLTLFDFEKGTDIEYAMQSKI
ncbi:TolC family protein [Limibacter armeniacum]|uniref:TolC family protein n=1 Tax=Limibacter armeniacum TaxID=466084 RepID=UPI002FE6A83F